MKIQPLSALVGAASLAVVLFTLSAFQHPSTFPAHPFPVHVQGFSTPRETVMISFGAPFLVPSGKVLVITGAEAWKTSGTSCDFSADIHVDGQLAWSGGWLGELRPASGASITVLAGSQVDVLITQVAGLIPPSCPDFDGQAWGYLADA